MSNSETTRPADCEYVVVGSGAGGGTLAARLAEAGRTVVLLEAGGDAKQPASDSGASRLPDDYDVPAFHAYASENDAMKWDFFVRHYANDERQRRDHKYREEWGGKRVDGVLYPRAGTLGGCTAHNAMIMVYPHNADWDGIAQLTGDPSWNAANMRAYFERLENCDHRPFHRWLAKFGIDLTRHGWNGWLQTEMEMAKSAFGDKDLVKVMIESVGEALLQDAGLLERVWWGLESQGDPNDWRLVERNAVGVRYTPLTTRNHQRMGSRERVLKTASKHPDRLKIELNALATRVLFDGDRAVGVAYLKGERLYRAHGRLSGGDGERRDVRASREVILAGGAFNTPQLLMLSGIGPREVLERFGIKTRVDLPGVGKNLQDRYEVSVVNRMNFDEWEVLKGARFAKGDPPYQQWANQRDGVYATNGAMLSVIRRSASNRTLPDLFLLGLLGAFQGYYPGYSSVFAERLNCMSWTVLKAHTNNRAGEVTLRSADPRDLPYINFRYFEEGSDGSREDLDAMLEGIRFARSMTAALKKNRLIAEEELPGEQLQTDDQLRDFVRDNAWGHHASCTCPIGPREQAGVLSSDFRVHGARGLRVVDASVFPRIPGFFIVSAVYMIGEKAADVILADGERAGQ